MNLAIMQPYIFPYIGYFQLLNAVDKWVIYDDVNFIKKGWINRNYILINDRPSLYTIPLKNGSQNELINNVFISYNEAWRQKLLKKIEFSYKKAPFYATIYPLLEEVLSSKPTLIKDLNYLSLIRIAAYLDIDTEIIESSSIYGNRHLKGQDRIIDICKQNKCKTYINPSGGKKLYKNKVFLENKIDLFFHYPNAIIYNQYSKQEFVPWLSIIDVLMFNSVEEISRMLQDYKLDK